MSRLLRPALLLSAAWLFAPAAWSELSLSIQISPPPLPVYAQPAVPGQGYQWTPGYWRWHPGDAAYYWVPGTWVMAPSPGLLWTPGYWAFESGGYLWRGGYWGASVGYYGGINYGFGYGGIGYLGGRWDRGVFRYNAAVNNVPRIVVNNVYRTRVVQHITRVSYHGGPGGEPHPPTAAELRLQNQVQRAPTEHQQNHEREALAIPIQRASINHGAPPIAATRQPSAFNAPGAVRARPSPSLPPAVRDLPKSTQPTPANAGDRPGPQGSPQWPAPADRPDKVDRPERPIRVDRADRPERPERP